MKKRTAIVFFLITMSLFSQSIISSANKSIRINSGDSIVDFTKYTIYAEATAELLDEENIKSEVQLILQSEAESETMKILYETISDISLNSYETVGSLLEKNPELNSYVLDSIRQARLIGVSYPSRKSIKVAMSLDLTQKNKINIVGSILNNLNNYIPEPVVTYFNPLKEYSSLIIDARGINFNPSLFPAVYDEDGNTIYELSYIDKKSAYKNGFVMYSKYPDIKDKNIKDLGKNPYTVVAWNTRGRLSGDIVIGNEDASIIASSKSLKKALRECRVVVIID